MEYITYLLLDIMPTLDTGRIGCICVHNSLSLVTLKVRYPYLYLFMYYVDIILYICMYIYVQYLVFYLGMYVVMYVCIFVCILMYVWPQLNNKYIFRLGCMYVCMYVCMYKFLYVYIVGLKNSCFKKIYNVCMCYNSSYTGCGFGLGFFLLLALASLLPRCCGAVM